MIDYATCRHLNRDLAAECLDFAGEASEVTLRRGLAVIEGDLMPDGKRLLRVGTHRYQVNAAAYGKATSGATEDEGESGGLPGRGNMSQWRALTVAHRST